MLAELVLMSLICVEWTVEMPAELVLMLIGEAFYKAPKSPDPQTPIIELVLIPAELVLMPAEFVLIPGGLPHICLRGRAELVLMLAEWTQIELLLMLMLLVLVLIDV